MNLKEKVLFMTKVTLVHFVTYMICGLFFMMIGNYRDHIELIGFKSMEKKGVLI